MPTRPNSWRLASATNALPGPTIMSTGPMPSIPKAIAASACTPPSAKMRSAPEVAIACSVGACTVPARGGVHAVTSATPATFGTSTVMNAQASIGTRPDGQ